MRAGFIIHGESLVLESIQKQKALLVFLANDASNTTTKRFTDKASFYQIPLSTVLSGNELSHAIGKENRKTLAVCSQAFVDLMVPLLNE